MKVFAFTDESGNHGFDFTRSDVSEFFIISAIIVEEDKLETVSNEVEEVRKRYFQTGEIKSSSIGSNHQRRCIILNALLKSEWKVFSIVVDKKKIYSNSGLMYKKSFYKFLNNIVHKELRQAFSDITICADELGNNNYMKSFCEYVKKNQEVPDLFGNNVFEFQNSKHSNLIQLADLISGTLSQVYESSKNRDIPDYCKMLKNKIINLDYFPRDILRYKLGNDGITKDYDTEIADICYMQAIRFIKDNENRIHNDNVEYQIIILKYLCFRFVNNDSKGYISTNELLSNLKYRTHNKLSVYYFRTQIIAKLRDSGVIISSSPHGYKIPSTEKELYDFVNHGVTIIYPMLERLKICRDKIKLGTNGRVDLFNKDELALLRKIYSIENKSDAEKGN